MSQTAINVVGLGKRYRLGTLKLGKSRSSLRVAMAESLSQPLRSLRARMNGGYGIAPAIFWALRNVSFEVQQAEVIGVVGRNGAGKSTLLKLLARITEPTEGYADIRGRVRALLEVGTGFQPELTGRENIFLNGAILGMKRAEIASKFDEIVAFSEVERFVDTPVKRYSSGMYVRLAFAVAAHLESEVLIVDEVLAVGDAAFQRKCLGKIGDVARGGRTVLFVSHNMAAVESLCTRAILLEGGSIKMVGPAHQVVGAYASHASGFTPTVHFSEQTRRSGTGGGRIIALEFVDQDGQPLDRVKVNRPLRVRIHFDSFTTESRARASIFIRDRYSRYACEIRSIFTGSYFPITEGESYVFEASVDALPLYPGTYTLGVSVASANANEDHDFIDDAVELTMEDDGALVEDGSLDPKWGQFYIPSRWRQASISHAPSRDDATPAITPSSEIARPWSDGLGTGARYR